LEQQTHYTIEIFETFNLLRSITRFATGPDGVSGLIYKSFAEFLAEPLTILFNFSTSQYIIPTLWKQAIVVPIPKSNNEHRPISLLCHPAKILEKLVLSKWIVLSLQKPFSPTQFAFVLNVKYGGCSNVLTLARIWTLKAFDDGAQYVRWVAVDLKKAFDVTSHKTILDTPVNHFHVNNSAVLWLHDYFVDRFQGVVTNLNSSSPLLPCTSGVP
jgi:hypothetical protein